jgi:hypothetical protein
MQYITQLASATLAHAHTAAHLASRKQLYLLSRIVKEQPIDASVKKHQSIPPRESDCCFLVCLLLVEPIGIEPMTSCLQSRRSPS